MQGSDARSNRMATKDVSVVLTHGAWANGSSWGRVITPLEAEGVKLSAASNSVAWESRLLTAEDLDAEASRIEQITGARRPTL
jgi:hypothetical protein